MLSASDLFIVSQKCPSQQSSLHFCQKTHFVFIGFYMMVTSNSTQDEIAELFTQDLPSAKEMCVRFW